MIRQDSNRAPSVPLGMRLKAWWNGERVVVRPNSSRVRGRLTPAEEQERERASSEISRIEAMQMVWGPGFCSPGGPSFVCSLVEPMRLAGSKSLLEIGTGLGGAARTMAEKFGARVTGLEHDPALAQAGMSLSDDAGLGKSAAVEHTDLETLTLKDSAFDCIFSKETFFKVENKERMLKAVVAGLKPGGHLLFTDYTLSSTAPGNEALERWLQCEAPQPHPWTGPAYVALLGELGLDVRLQEDLTPGFQALVTQAWNAALKNLAEAGFDRARVEALAKEAEIWTLRAKAFESGALRVTRFHATKKAGSKLLSDW